MLKYPILLTSKLNCLLFNTLYVFEFIYHRKLHGLKDSLNQNSKSQLDIDGLSQEKTIAVSNSISSDLRGTYKLFDKTW